MTLAWSGPARALQAHLDLWEVAHLTTEEIHSAAESEEEEVRLSHAASAHFSQIAKLASSFVAPAIIDGQTLADRRDNPDELTTHANHVRAALMLEYEYEIANEGITHYVSEEMMDMISAIANEAESEPIFPTDLPCPVGLIIFEQPMIVPDLHPET